MHVSGTGGLAYLLHCGVIDISKTVPEDIALWSPDQEAPLTNAKDRLGLDSVDVRFIRVLLANDVLELAACLSLTKRRPCLTFGGDGLSRILVHALGCDRRIHQGLTCIANMAFIEFVSCHCTMLCPALLTEKKLVIFVKLSQTAAGAVIASEDGHATTKWKSWGSRSRGSAQRCNPGDRPAYGGRLPRNAANDGESSHVASGRTKVGV